MTVLLERDTEVNGTLDVFRRLDDQMARCINKCMVGRVCFPKRCDGQPVRITGRSLVNFSGEPDLCKFTIKFKYADGKAGKWTGISDDADATDVDGGVLLAARDQRPLMVFV